MEHRECRKPCGKVPSLHRRMLGGWDLDAGGAPSLSSDSPWAPSGGGQAPCVDPREQLHLRDGCVLRKAWASVPGKMLHQAVCTRQGGPHAGAECLTPVR